MGRARHIRMTSHRCIRRFQMELMSVSPPTPADGGMIRPYHGQETGYRTSAAGAGSMQKDWGGLKSIMPRTSPFMILRNGRTEK